MVISLLGVSVYPTKSLYRDGANLGLVEGEFINSTDVLLNSFDREKFILLGSRESIKKHKEAFRELINKRDVIFEEIDTNDLNSIFLKIMSILIENIYSDILFDITHSFRDSVIMSIISTIVSQTVYKREISLIYAKEAKDEQSNKYYEYRLVGDEILNTANISFTISSFIHTLKVPPLYSKYKLHSLLSDFSTHLISNQLNELYDEDLPSLSSFIDENRKQLFFVKPILNELEEIINKIKAHKNSPIYEKYLFFAKFFNEKRYFVNASTYLIESIGYYIGDVLKELGYIDFDYSLYDNQQKIVALLKFNASMKDYKFPNEYFVEINYKIIKEFANLRAEVADIRNNLAHINPTQSYGDIGNRLKELIDRYQNLIDTKILYQLDTSDSNKEHTLSYQLDIYNKKLLSFKRVPSASAPKIEKVYNKYKDGSLRDLTMFDIDRLKRFLKQEEANIAKLINMKKDKIFYID